MSEFTVEISRPGKFGALTSAALGLPATWAEYQDAKEKARITDERVIYEVEICETNRGGLQSRIASPINLLELNLLAQRLAGLSKRQSGIFDAMVDIEAQQSKDGTISLPRLINFTHSLDSCHVAYGVLTDAALGKFLFENDMLSDEAHETAQIKQNISLFADEYLALLGRKHREAENGVFTGVGYVEIEEINEVYTPGNTVYFDRSGAPVVLEIINGIFDEPGYGNGLTTTLDMPPLTEKGLNDTLEKVKADALERCSYRCIDCLIPTAKDLIDEAEDYNIVTRFAEALANLERRTLPIIYKAVLEAIDPPDLESATSLIAEVEQFTLDSELSGPEDYAREYLSRLKGGDESIDLSGMINLYALGEQVMKLKNAEWTSYGVLKRKDGGPVLAPEQDAGPGMKMEGP